VQAFVDEFVDQNEVTFRELTSSVVSPWERLRTMVRFLSQEMIFNQKTNKVFLNLYHMGAHDEQIRQCLVRSYAQFRKSVADIIRYGIERGEFAEVNADELALFFVGTVEGLYLQETMDPGLCDQGRVEHLLFENLRQSLMKEEQKPN